MNQFVEDENEESFSCSVRISAQYLLMVRPSWQDSGFSLIPVRFVNLSLVLTNC